MPAQVGADHCSAVFRYDAWLWGGAVRGFACFMHMARPGLPVDEILAIFQPVHPDLKPISIESRLVVRKGHRDVTSSIAIHFYSIEAMQRFVGWFMDKPGFNTRRAMSDPAGSLASVSPCAASPDCDALADAGADNPKKAPTRPFLDALDRHRQAAAAPGFWLNRHEAVMS